MRWNRVLLALAIGVSMAGPASALSILVSGPTEAEVGDTVTFTISLDSMTAITGYELFLSWDPTEIAYLPSLDGFGGVLGNLFVSSALPFVTPNDTQLPAGPTDARFSFLFLSPIPTTALFELDFEVLEGAGVADGVDFWIDLASGGGINGSAAQGSLPIAAAWGVDINPGSVLFVYYPIPEPSVFALAAVGLIGLGTVRRGRRR